MHETDLEIYWAAVNLQLLQPSMKNPRPTVPVSNGPEFTKVHKHTIEHDKEKGEKRKIQKLLLAESRHNKKKRKRVKSVMQMKNERMRKCSVWANFCRVEPSRADLSHQRALRWLREAHAHAGRPMCNCLRERSKKNERAKIKREKKILLACKVVGRSENVKRA